MNNKFSYDLPELPTGDDAFIAELPYKGKRKELTFPSFEDVSQKTRNTLLWLEKNKKGIEVLENKTNRSDKDLNNAIIFNQKFSAVINGLFENHPDNTALDVINSLPTTVLNNVLTDYLSFSSDKGKEEAKK